MNLKNKLLFLLKSRRGNATLLAVITAIAATFSVYFFISLTEMTNETKQRNTHLYNAYQMGLAVEGAIAGVAQGKNWLDGEISKKKLEGYMPSILEDNSFVTLADLEHHGYILPADDPTASIATNSNIPYDDAATGVKITYAKDSSGTPLDDEDEKVTHLVLKVNLVGTSNGGTAHNCDGSMGNAAPFYYVHMTDKPTGIAGPTFGQSDTTQVREILTTDAGYELGILSNNIRAIDSVNLPVDKAICVQSN